MAEFNPGVQNAAFNWPLKTLIPEEIILCPADPNMALVIVMCRILFCRIPDSSLPDTGQEKMMTG
jgi:hypothetical protein